MTKLFILLTGYLLFGQPSYSVAQKNVQLLDNVQLGRCCEKIQKVGPCLAFTGDHNGKMRFRLLGIYSHGPTLFFWLRLNNRSPFDYAIDSIRFYIVERGRRNLMSCPGLMSRVGLMSCRGLQLVPVYVYDSMVTVAGRRRATSIYAIPRFQLPAGSRLLIVVRERVPATQWSAQGSLPGRGRLPPRQVLSPEQAGLSAGQGRELHIQTGNFLLQRPRLI